MVIWDGLSHLQDFRGGQVEVACVGLIGVCPFRTRPQSFHLVEMDIS